MLNKHDLKFKRFLAMQDKLQKLEEEVRKLPLVELKQPYNAGWRITYRLRDDILRRKDSDIIKQVLELGYDSQLTYNVEYVKAIRRGEKSINKVKKKKKIKIDLKPRKYCISEKRYLQFPEEVQSYFHLDTTCDAYKIYGRKYYYASLSDHWLKLRAKPNIITHTRRKGGDKEIEIAFLRDKLDEFWREQHNYSKSHPAFKDRARTRDRISKFKKGELDDIYNDKIPLEYDY